MYRTAVILVAILAVLSVPALAQNFDYQPLPPTQPLQPLVPNYQIQLPAVPVYQMRVPPVPQYQPTPARHWRDIVDDVTRQFTTPEQIERQFERMDRADQRRIWGRCAKYSIHCANVLRSLGGR